MRGFLLAAFSFVFILTADIFAQPDRKAHGAGTVHFVEGDSARGYISFFNANMIEFNGKKHSPQSVDSFSFHDYLNNRRRSFVTLDFDDKRSGLKGFAFFEMLFEFESFALLEKIEPREVFNSTTVTNGPGMDPSTNTTYVEYEHIYVFDKHGNIETFLQSRHLDPEPILRKEDKTRLLSEKLLFLHLGPHLNQLKEFAKTNKLKFDNKEDFMKIMEHYKTLIE